MVGWKTASVVQDNPKERTEKDRWSVKVREKFEAHILGHEAMSRLFKYRELLSP